MSLSLAIAIFSLALYLFLSMELLFGVRKIGSLENIEPAADDKCPLVSIIIPALNEAATIKPALYSVLSLDYPALEIIAINDRSTDKTGIILDKIARNNPQLKVYHLTELPPGWLGKNHALFYGASKAAGDLLLFTDADVVMTPESLRRAVSFMLAQRLDHLAVFFQTVVPGGLLNMFIIDFGYAFLAAVKPWKARDADSTCHIGIGAFNLVQAETYRCCGTHKAIAMAPVDDMELGRLIKSKGNRQDCLFGNTSISVRWYNSLTEMVHGLEKNIFPFCNYSLFRVSSVSAVLIILRIWPMVALVCGSGLVMQLNAILIFIQIGIAVICARKSSIMLRHVCWFPLAPLLELYVLWNSAIKTISRGGILWRNSFYSLTELQKKK